MKYLILIFITLLSSNILQAKSIKALIITGGHSYDTVQFFEMFDSFNDINYKHSQQPNANKSIATGEAQEYDIIVFYDMWQTISGQEKQGYIELTNQGIPLLFLHHSLVSYTGWPEFEKIIGGKYIDDKNFPSAKQSSYKHDVWIEIKTDETSHPATIGLGNFSLFDEVYGNTRVSKDVNPLLKTIHPESSLIIGWENRYNNSKIIYIQPGHGHHAYEDKNFRQLIRQTINYLSKL